MAHLLMIESWVGASGNLLPPLLKELGHSYTFVTRKPSHYQSALSTEKHAVFRYADNVIEAETNDIQALTEAVKSVRFDGVITVCDYYIETVCEIAKIFRVPCPFPENVKIARQKHLMRQALDKAGLSNPVYGFANDWQEVEKVVAQIGYPLVIKPVDLASSAFVRLIQNEDELKDAYQNLEAFPLNFRDQPRNCTYLLEEYMSGVEVSVESVSYKGETTIIGITDKSVTGAPYFIENGHMLHKKHCSKNVNLPSGTPIERAKIRDNCIADAANIKAEMKIALIGVVNPLVAAIKERGGKCLPCDLQMEKTQWGEPVEKDMEKVLDIADGVICTGMTLSNGTFDQIVKRTAERNIPLTVYAQTGSAIAARFVNKGITALIAEPFPFSQFSAESTSLYYYEKGGDCNEN